MKELLLTLIFVLLSTQLFAQNNALQFDGDNDYVSIPGLLTSGYSAVTVETWVYAESFNGATDANITNLIRGGSESVVLRIGDGDIDNNKPQFVLYIGLLQYKVTATFGLSLNTWYHIAGVYDGSEMKLYINGILNNTLSQTGVVITTSEALILAGATAPERLLDGMLDETRIWNDARTEEEIRQNMYRELPDPSSETNLVAYYKMNDDLNDGSSNTNTGTFNGGTASYSTSPAMFGPKNALEFDGSNDYVSINSTFGLGVTNVTIESWVYIPTTSKSGTIARLGQNDTGFGIGVGNGNFETLGNELLVLIDKKRWIDPNVNIGTGWHHVAFSVGSSNEVNIYLDGVNVYTEASGSAAVSPTAPSYIGAANSSSRIFSGGKIDDVRYWGEVRSATQIRENMCKSLTGNETNLAAYYNFDNGLSSSTTVPDFSGNSNDGTCIGYYSNEYEYESGTAEQISGNQLYDSDKSWAVNEFAGSNINIDGYGIYRITSNTAQYLTLNISVGNVVNVGYTITINPPGNVSWISSTAFNTWLNTSSTDWTSEANWSNGVPSATSNVGIYNFTNEPDILGSLTFNHLYLGSGITTTLTSGMTINGSFILNKNLDLNGQTITLGSSATLIEDGGYISGSTGQIQTTRTLSNIDENIAGLGIKITEDGDLGESTLIRTHSPGGTSGINRKFQITTTNAPTNATLVFNYLDSELNGVTEANLQLFKSADGTTWTEQAATLSTAENTLTLSGINSFSYWTAGDGNEALPVELTSFTANVKENSVKLIWQTATEVNNYGFQVERKKVKGESDWEVVGFVEGHGNSNSPKDYTFTDSQTFEVFQNLEGFNGVIQYRLKQLDFDGNYEYSDVLEVKLTENVKEYKLEQNFPNPFNPSTVIKYSIPTDVRGEMQDVRLTVYDILGNEVATLVNESQKSGNYEVKFNASSFATGLYIYRIQAGSFNQVRKMMLIK